MAITETITGFFFVLIVLIFLIKSRDHLMPTGSAFAYTLPVGDPTAIVSTSNGIYYVILEGISVGQERLSIKPNVFKLSSSGHGEMILNTGFGMMQLSRDGYEPLCRKVQSLLDGRLERTNVGMRSGGPPMLCYMGRVDTDLISFPEVSFHLAQDAEFVLGIRSMFLQVSSDTFCMAVTPL